MINFFRLEELHQHTSNEAEKHRSRLCFLLVFGSIDPTTVRRDSVVRVAWWQHSTIKKITNKPDRGVIRRSRDLLPKTSHDNEQKEERATRCGENLPKKSTSTRPLALTSSTSSVPRTILLELSDATIAPNSGVGTTNGAIEGERIGLLERGEEDSVVEPTGRKRLTRKCQF
ncbi:hypothetical protein BHE74_00023305 [Ensete ventricosum]|nr:hypothetical protein GW17_00014564 [Ensete ventricosum]RWW69131.1 hypothetical protein BHE74_00023305 [Ensete ventricosum]RZR78340.1 hypothetical protein BHM03_00003633 [Ensete ventricosum]